MINNYYGNLVFKSIPPLVHFHSQDDYDLYDLAEQIMMIFKEAFLLIVLLSDISYTIILGEVVYLKSPISFPLTAPSQF